MNDTTTADAEAPFVSFDDQRALDIIAGLRALADLAENNPAIALHFAKSCSFDRLLVSVSHLADPRQVLADFARAVPRANKEYDGDVYFNLNIDLSPTVGLQVYAAREKVCERVVTGTREVTEEVPDPAVLATVPKVTVIKTVEDIEWVCRPLLADGARVSS